MFTIKNYVLVESLKQAYKLNQDNGNVILGGTGWLKMGERNIQTAIDLSNLGLDKIEELEDSFKIGCMATLRDIEVSKELNSYFNGAIAKSLVHIVGVQFRNCATIGGSIYSRFGFSDVLTILLSLDTYVELYKGGIIPLYKYVERYYDEDIIVSIIIKKDSRQVSYLTHRMSKTDIPSLACAVSRFEDKWTIVLGARPQKAIIVQGSEDLGEIPTSEEIEKFINKVLKEVEFDTNMRASKEYRQILAKAFIKRGIEEVVGGSYEN